MTKKKFIVRFIGARAPLKKRQNILLRHSVPLQAFDFIAFTRLSSPFERSSKEGRILRCQIAKYLIILE